MRKVILAAGIIVTGALVMSGYVIYKVGEEMMTMHRCGCRYRF